MKRGTPRHPKMHALANSLGVPLYAAVGIMEMIWHEAGRYTPLGDVGSVPDRQIASWVDWSKNPEKLIGALVECGWFDRSEDYRIYIHDWPDHCEQTVIKWLEYNHKDFLPIYGKSLENRTRKSKHSHPSREAKAKEEDSVSGSEEKKEGDLPPEFDEQFQDYRRLFTKAAGGAVIDEDFQKGSFCWRAWCLLDFAQRTLAVDGLSTRIAAGILVKHKAASYLQSGEYKRPIAMPAIRSNKLTAEEIAVL